MIEQLFYGSSKVVKQKNKLIKSKVNKNKNSQINNSNNSHKSNNSKV
jgi:hypothetical protein